MKKIILILLITGLMTNCFSQSVVPAGTKQISIAEAKVMQGNTEPTINGIPYSQYKAQQDALKQKTIEKQTAELNWSSQVTPGGNNSAKPVVAKVEQAKLPEGGLSSTSITGTDPSAKQSAANTTPVPEVKSDINETNRQSIEFIPSKVKESIPAKEEAVVNKTTTQPVAVRAEAGAATTEQQKAEKKDEVIKPGGNKSTNN